MTTDIEKNQLVGRVKQVKQECFNAVLTKEDIALGDIINDFHHQNYIEEYNTLGFLTKVSRGEGGVTSVFKYENDVLIEEDIYGSSGSLLMRHVHIYDSNGNRIEMTKYFSNGRVSNSYTYKYDNKGNIIEGYTDESLDAKIAYLFKYDDENRLIEKYNLRNLLVSKHDKNGNIIEKYEYYDSNAYSSKAVKKYSENGNILENRIYDINNNLVGQITKNVYDVHNNIVETCDYMLNGILDTKISFQYKYDKNNNWISKIEFRNYSFGYDKAGDWSKIELVSPEPVYVTNREILYWV